jgi:hypothetical protein
MTERKSWTEEEDSILKMLKEDEGIKKWSDISKIMDNKYNIKGRTGKQCR